MLGAGKYSKGSSTANTVKDKTDKLPTQEQTLGNRNKCLLMFSTIRKFRFP